MVLSFIKPIEISSRNGTKKGLLLKIVVMRCTLTWIHKHTNNLRDPKNETTSTIWILWCQKVNIYYLVGGWATPLKNISQLGWLATQYMGKSNWCSKPPTSYSIWNLCCNKVGASVWRTQWHPLAARRECERLQQHVPKQAGTKSAKQSMGAN